MKILMSFVAGLYVLITLARLPELFPALMPLQLGKVAFALGLALVLGGPGQPRALLAGLPIGPPLLFLLLLGVCSVPISVWRGGALESLMNYAKTLGGFAVLVCLTAGREQALRLFVITAIGLLAGLLLLDTGTGRLHVSSSYDPNDMALLFVVFLPVLAAEGLVGRGLPRLAAWGAAGAALASIPLTQSRGALVALAAVGLHALLLAKRRRLMILILCGLGAAILIQAADTSFWARFTEVADQSDYNLHGKSGRLEIWKDGLALFFRRPLGVGIGQFGSALGMLGSGLYKTAHNSYIQILVELGLPGIIAYGLMLWRVRRMALACAVADSRADQVRGLGLSLAFTGFAVGSLFLSQAYGVILYTLLALIAVHWLARERNLAQAPAAPAAEPVVPVSLVSKADAARHVRQERLRLGAALRLERPWGKPWGKP